MPLPQTPDVQIHAVTFEGETISIQFTEARDQSPSRSLMKRTTLPVRDHAELVVEIHQLLVDLVDAGDLAHRNPPDRVPM